MHRRMTAAAWFLTPEERGNPATDIDRRGDGPAASYSDGNDVRVKPELDAMKRNREHEQRRVRHDEDQTLRLYPAI